MDIDAARAMETAATGIIDLERKRAEIAESEQQKKERLIAETYRTMGRIETADIFGKLATVATFVWLKEVKESQIYKDIPGVETWEKFCNRLGKSRRTVDEQLQNLEIMGEQFLATCRHFSLSYKDLRKLRKSAADGEISITDSAAIIAGETIPLDPEHKDDLEAAVESLLEDKDRAIEEKEATLRAKDRVLEEKEKVIDKQEKLIVKYEGEAKEHNYAPGEEAFLKEMENLATQFAGYELRIDPTIKPLPDDATPRMKAAYLETLGYMRRVVMAHYDTAVELYGEPELDSTWQPPYEREEEIPSDPPLEKEAKVVPIDGQFIDCGLCDHHKAMANKKKGVRIPGNFGKCTRPDGLCAAVSGAAAAMQKAGMIDNDTE